jgi:hypothetical protein
MTTILSRNLLTSAHAIDHGAPPISTVFARYPRWIHAEGRTHRLFSLGDSVYELATPSVMEDHDRSINASSSRAIPVEKLIQDVIDDPAVPLYWGANQPGMQAQRELTGQARIDAESEWLLAMEAAIKSARALAQIGAHKQLINRLLEPFSHINVVITSTNWSNFLHLRDHSDAEPHIAILAREIRKAIQTANVQKLHPGEWHLPMANSACDRAMANDDAHTVIPRSEIRYRDNLLKLSVARCASTSYKTVDGFDMTLDRAVALHDKLVGMDPLHASPCEHQAKIDKFNVNPNWMRGSGHWETPELSGNLGPGYIQYRKTLKGERR